MIDPNGRYSARSRHSTRSSMGPGKDRGEKSALRGFAAEEPVLGPSPALSNARTSSTAAKAPITAGRRLIVATNAISLG